MTPFSRGRLPLPLVLPLLVGCRAAVAPPGAAEEGEATGAYRLDPAGIILQGEGAVDDLRIVRLR